MAGTSWTVYKWLWILDFRRLVQLKRESVQNIEGTVKFKQVQGY